ncbi:MAG: OmpA family protein [Rhodobacteraceae bacterium]|nr:OmpA family protein [Paracoccaceae bacterium]
MFVKTPLLLAAVGAFALSGCMSDQGYGYSNPNDPNANARTGAITGAVVGGLAGALSGGRGAFGKTVVGAAAGGVVGAIAGGALDRQAKDLRSGLGDDNITVVNTGNELVVSMPQDILFATDSTEVQPSLQRELAAVAQNLRQYPDSLVTVIGHTDNVGTATYNQDLSQRRADAVSAILLQDGVRASRLIAYGRGESQPVATNLTPEGRAQNRRVEIHIHPNNG